MAEAPAMTLDEFFPMAAWAGALAAVPRPTCYGAGGPAARR